MNISELKGKIIDLRKRLGLEAKRARIIECESEMAEEHFWDDRTRAAQVSQECSDLSEEVGEWDNLLKNAEDLETLSRDADEGLQKEIAHSFEDLRQRFSRVEFRALFSGRYDRNNALLAVHAGTGGVDAMDWAEMLMRMYVRFCEQQGWRMRILDEQRGGEAGVKSTTLSIEGAYAYGYLKAEHGVHRLVRISPFDAEKMRHTSFALVEVIPELGETADIEVKQEDVRIDVFRSSGAGGQSVNTTDSAVRITHMPTGIVVTCQNERSQSQNKEMALRYLKSKLHRLKEAEREEERQTLRGTQAPAAWGNQIRSYVLHPYKMVKDHRTEHETADTEGVLDGDLMPFIESYLRKIIVTSNQ